VNSVHEQELKIQSAEAELAGTLCFPDGEGEFPAVLMVHGSGPLDRDENMKGQQLNIFNHIACELADFGIASFRYDKRGCGSSSGDFMSAGHSELIEDAVRCFDTLSGIENISAKQLYILGHSEGCIIGAQVTQLRPSVAGLIQLCPFIEKLDSVLVRQAAQLEKEIEAMPGINGLLTRALMKIIGSPSASQQRLLRKVRETDSPVVRIGLSRQTAKWLREILQLDPESIYASIDTPMLLIGGEKDLQCNPQDVYRIAEVTQGQTETLLVDDMTHLLRIDEKPATILGSARLLKEPIASAVLERIPQWVLEESSALTP